MIRTSVLIRALEALNRAYDALPADDRARQSVADARYVLQLELSAHLPQTLVTTDEA